MTEGPTVPFNVLSSNSFPACLIIVLSKFESFDMLTTLIRLF